MGLFHFSFEQRWRWWAHPPSTATRPASCCASPGLLRGQFTHTGVLSSYTSDLDYVKLVFEGAKAAGDSMFILATQVCLCLFALGALPSRLDNFQFLRVDGYRSRPVILSSTQSSRSTPVNARQVWRCA